MKEVISYKTRDGKLHESLSDAKKHADKLYGDELTKLAHQLVQIDKYKAMTEFLDRYDFSTLMALRKDIELVHLSDD